MAVSEDWKAEAEKKQQKYIGIFGSRKYDEIPKSDSFFLKKKVGYATCGEPSEPASSSNYYTGYTQEQLNYILRICEKIVEKSDCDPIRFGCITLILHSKNKEGECRVFRITSSSGTVFFIDVNARVYEGWDHFKEKNKLPACEYCFPVNGDYFNATKIEFALSPENSVRSKVIRCADTVGTVVGVTGAAVSAASLAVTVAPAALAVTGVSAACTGAYCASRSVYTLYDRKKHDQSVGLKDKESRFLWLSLGLSAVSFGSTAVLGKVRAVADSGKTLSKAARCGIHALTATSVIFTGYGFVDDCVDCIERYKKGLLNKEDIFHLSCGLLFLFNTLACAKATTELVNNMSAFEASPSVTKKLTKTQKRNLRRRIAKQKAKGISTTSKSEKSSLLDGVNKTFYMNLLKICITSFDSRIQTILFTFQKIGHDIMCWKEGKLNNEQLFCTIMQSINLLYEQFQSEIKAVWDDVKKFSQSLFYIAKEKFSLWYKNSSEKCRDFFFTKVLNINDEIETLLSDTEQEITAMHDQSVQEPSTNDDDDTTEDDNTNDNVEDQETCEDNNLTPEFQKFIVESSYFILEKPTLCNDLEDYADVLEEMKCLVVMEFKEKIKTYKSALEATKSTLEATKSTLEATKSTLEATKSQASKSFDIDLFHERMGIKGNVAEHYLNQAIERLSTESSRYKLMKTCKQLKKERGSRITSIWEVATEGLYFYHGSFGAGYLSKVELLTIMSKVVAKDLNHEDDKKNCNWIECEDKGTIMIEVNHELDTNVESGKSSEVSGKVSLYIVVTNKLDEENTAFGIITVHKFN